MGEGFGAQTTRTAHLTKRVAIAMKPVWHLKQSDCVEAACGRAYQFSAR